MWTLKYIIHMIILITLTIGLKTRTLSKEKRHKRAFSYIANETACVVDNILYHEGDSIPTDDPCEFCKCRPPGFSCVLRECLIKPGCKAIRRNGECCPEYQCGCEHNGNFFKDGDRIPNAESPCYSCYCQGSSITCALADCKFRFDCEPQYVIGECCPRYDHCLPETSNWLTSTIFSNPSSAKPSTTLTKSSSFTSSFTTSSPLLTTPYSLNITTSMSTNITTTSKTTFTTPAVVSSNISNDADLHATNLLQPLNNTFLLENSLKPVKPTDLEEEKLSLLSKNESSNLNKTLPSTDDLESNLDNKIKIIFANPTNLQSSVINKVKQNESKPNVVEDFILNPENVVLELNINLKVDKNLTAEANDLNKNEEKVTDDQVTTSVSSLNENKKENVEKVLVKEISVVKDESIFVPVTTESISLENELKILSNQPMSETKSNTTTLFINLVSDDISDLNINITDLFNDENFEIFENISSIDSKEETGIENEVNLLTSENNLNDSTPSFPDKNENESITDYLDSFVKNDEFSSNDRFNFNETNSIKYSDINHQFDNQSDEIVLNDDIYPTTNTWLSDFNLSAEHKGEELLDSTFSFLSDNYNLTFNSSLFNSVNFDFTLDNITNFSINQTMEVMGF